MVRAVASDKHCHVCGLEFHEWEERCWLHAEEIYNSVRGLVVREPFVVLMHPGCARWNGWKQ